MSVVVKVGSFKEMKEHFSEVLKLKKKKIERAIDRACGFAIAEIGKNVPVAFSELKDSIHVVETGSGESIEKSVVVDAPHASAVEVGSRPHTPPIEPLIEWVKKRGMQGLTSQGRVKRNRTRQGKIIDPNLEPARHIAKIIRSMQNSNKSTDTDAPEQIARAIQFKISKEGTKPTFFVSKSIPAIGDKYFELLKEAMEDR